MPDRFDLIVRDSILVTPGGRRPADIGIANGRFAAIGAPGELPPAVEEIDASGLYALPGVIDAHVHFRQPGLEYKEDWLTGSRAAVMGGVTTVIDMPNNVPPTDTVGRARKKLALAAASAYCDFGMFGLADNDPSTARMLLESGLIVGLKVFMGPTTGGLSAPSEANLRRILEQAAAAGVRVAFHAEDAEAVAAAEVAVRKSGRSDARAHLDSRPVEAESVAIDRAGQLLHETGARGHVAHVSSAEGLAAIAKWRAVGVDMTAEVTAHHALLGAEVYDTIGTLAKVNPPVRGEPHASALLAALARGEIDAIGSDHAPHAAEEKSNRDIWSVPSGFAGVELSLRLFLTRGVNAGRMTLEQLSYVTSEGPARAWGLWPRKGSVAVGSDADLTLVDLEAPGLIRAAELHGKNNATPFEGWPTLGMAVATIVGGRVVMRAGQLVGELGWGRALQARASTLRGRTP